MSEIQSSDLTGYMAWLRTEYKPRRWNGSSEPLSAKSIRNVWVTFRSFFGWLQGEFLPEEPEVLSIAGILGVKVYEALDLPKPDPELIKIYVSFAHLTGQDRSNLALALLEVKRILKEDNISTKSPDAKEIVKNTFEKYGLSK